MANSCGLLTLLCILSLTLLAVSLAFAGDDHEARAHDDVALARSMRSVVPRAGRRGNEEIAVDNGVSGGRHGRRRGNRGNRRNNGGRRREGRGRGGGGRRGGRRGRGGGGRPPFNRRERKLVGRLSNATGAFSLQLYSMLTQRHQELVFSPYSIHTALTMTYMGAREKTAKQMLKVLGLKKLRKDKAHLAYAALVNSLDSHSGNVTLQVANAVYVKPNLPIENAFRSRLQTMYRAAFDHFNFQAVGGPEAPINAWVANRTQNKIQNLLNAGTIDSLTALIIINAIYFKGGWMNKFDAQATSEQDFHRDDGSMARVQMMRRTGQYNYTQADDLSSHIVELPYQDGRFSMFIILPVTRNRMSDVEARLSMESLNNHLQNMRPTNINLNLPKFKSESKFHLKDTLKRMGMRLPFSNRAKFDGICSTHDLKIVDVIHQAVVEVSEEGTEAAASTAVIIGLRSFRVPSTPVIKADHPFLYAIRDNLTQTWIFLGKYSAQQ